MLTPPTLRFEERLLAELARLERFAAARFGPLADDVVQETLLRALRARATFDGSRDMWPWLRTTAIRTASSRRASDGRLGEVSLGESLGDSLEGRAMAPASDAAAGLLDRLGPVERDAMDRFYLRGHSVAEIAAARQCPSGTVKAQLSRARRRLAGLLGASGLLALACFGFLAGRTSTASPSHRPVLRSASIKVEHSREAAARFLRVDRSQPNGGKPAPRWTVTGGTIVRAGLIQSPILVTPTVRRP